MSTYVVAEASWTWEGQADWFHDLVGAASDAGCQAIKTQWTSNPARMAERRSMPPGSYEQLRYDARTHDAFWKIAQANGLAYLCTVYIPEDIAAVTPYVDAFKVASLEALDLDFLEAHAKYIGLRQLIISTGCCDDEGLTRILDFREDNPAIDLRLLHCVAGYPAPMEQLNLSCIDGYYLSGFSDHTGKTLTGALAVMAGASIIEVHLRHPKTPTQNPDYGHSLLPSELEEYVANIRRAELAAGKGMKIIQPCEEPLRIHRVAS